MRQDKSTELLGHSSNENYNRNDPQTSQIQIFRDVPGFSLGIVTNINAGGPSFREEDDATQPQS